MILTSAVDNGRASGISPVDWYSIRQANLLKCFSNALIMNIHDNLKHKLMQKVSSIHL